jgi:hypothetical protein
MAEVKICKTCGVPVRIGKDHNWNRDGTITQKRDPDHRMLFFDSDSIDGLFANIEQLIGVSLEKIIVESKARATRAYISQLLRGARGKVARIIGLERIIRRVVEQGRILGYGDIVVTEFNWKENYMFCEIGRPYSLKLFCGDLMGANEAIRKVAGTVSYEEIGPDRYLIKNHQAPHAPELEDRLLPKPRPRKPGDITYETCPGCGVPVEIGPFSWDLVKGVITHRETGMRMAMFGPGGLQSVFDELEAELGESIPETIVEAQKMYVRQNPYLRWKGFGKEGVRRWLAIQGLGNLVSLDQGESGFSACIENPAIPTILVGSALGFFEYTTGTRGSARWSVSDDGDLLVEVRVAK